MAVIPVNFDATGVKKAFRVKNFIATGDFSTIGSRSGENYFGNYAGKNIIGFSGDANVFGQKSQYNDFGSRSNLNYFGQYSKYAECGGISTRSVIANSCDTFEIGTFGKTGYIGYGTDNISLGFGSDITRYYAGSQIGDLIGKFNFDNNPLLLGIPISITLDNPITENTVSNSNSLIGSGVGGFSNLPSGSSWSFETFEIYTGNSPPKSQIYGFDIDFNSLGAITVRGSTSLITPDIAVDNYMSPTTGLYTGPNNYSTISRKGLFDITGNASVIKLVFSCSTDNNLTYLMKGSYFKITLK
jgi:hypothetical protein